MTPIELIHKLNLNDIPAAVKKQAKLSILHLIEMCAGGRHAIVSDHSRTCCTGIWRNDPHAF